MKFILSPSKLQHSHAHLPPTTNIAQQLAPSLNLFGILQQMSEQEIASIMMIKGKLLDETVKLYQQFSANNSMIRAIDCYRGAVFQQLQLKQYSSSQRAYMNQHLRILSAMYGVLQPDSTIWPYRLDLTMKPTGISLVEYWQQRVAKQFASEEVLVNLASEEFSPLLEPLIDRVIHIHFQERQKDGQLKTVSTYAKQARGRMVHQCISREVKEPTELKREEIYGYLFDATMSTDHHYYFIKEKT
jgi:cytoplasmic iron level regulating protein YaaA (DUF328/UPF0246 family)